jgi:ribosomal protein L13
VSPSRYEPTQPPPRAVMAAYAAWLQARQDGVTRGRTAFCVARSGRLRGGEGTAAVDCGDTEAVVRAAAVNVFNGAEVNLVAACVHNASCGNIVREVIQNG